MPGRKKMFYVFYDDNDFVKYCGTAKDLVNDGRFKTEAIVRQVVNKIRNNKVKGTVIALKME